MKPNRHPITGAPATTRSEMGDWLTSHPDWKAHHVPATRKRVRKPTKDDRIAELEEEVRRLKDQIKRDRLDRVLIDPKTGRPRDLICRTKSDRWPAHIIRTL